MYKCWQFNNSIYAWWTIQIEHSEPCDLSIFHSNINIISPRQSSWTNIIQANKPESLMRKYSPKRLKVWKLGKVAESGEKLEKVGKSWEKWQKVVKISEKCLKVGENWLKVVKSGENHYIQSVTIHMWMTVYNCKQRQQSLYNVENM